jgi:hypothetical protein
MDHLVKEAIEIQLQTNKFNRNGGFKLSQAWQPILKQLQTASPSNEITAIFKLHPLTPIGSLTSMSQAIHAQMGQMACTYHYPDDGDRFSLRNVGFYKPPDATVCARKLN